MPPSPDFLTDPKQILHIVTSELSLPESSFKIYPDGRVDIFNSAVFRVTRESGAPSELFKNGTCVINFNRTTGNVVFMNDRGENAVKTLVGFPRYIKGNLQVQHGGLTTLVGGPEFVGDSTLVSQCLFENLLGAPETGEIFSCANSPNLKSLEGAPRSVDSFSCAGCSELTSLKGIPHVRETLWLPEQAFPSYELEQLIEPLPRVLANINTDNLTPEFLRKILTHRTTVSKATGMFSYLESAINSFADTNDILPLFGLLEQVPSLAPLMHTFKSDEPPEKFEL